jgi:hypothetical protein
MEIDDGRRPTIHIPRGKVIADRYGCQFQVVAWRFHPQRVSCDWHGGFRHNAIYCATILGYDSPAPDHADQRIDRGLLLDGVRRLYLSRTLGRPKTRRNSPLNSLKRYFLMCTAYKPPICGSFGAGEAITPPPKRN